MKTYLTEMKAIHNTTGELTTFSGPRVKANSYEEAEKWCKENKGHLKVVGELVSEIPCKDGTHEPDFENRIDYDTNAQLN